MPDALARWPELTPVKIGEVPASSTGQSHNPKPTTPLHHILPFPTLPLTCFITFGIRVCQLRPYTLESTGSRLIPEVKLVMVMSVLRWETTREYIML